MSHLHCRQHGLYLPHITGDGSLHFLVGRVHVVDWFNCGLFCRPHGGGRTCGRGGSSWFWATYQHVASATHLLPLVGRVHTMPLVGVIRVCVGGGYSTSAESSLLI